MNWVLLSLESHCSWWYYNCMRKWSPAPIFTVPSDSESIFPVFRYDPPPRALKQVLTKENNARRCWLAGFTKKGSTDLLGFVAANEMSLKIDGNVFSFVEAHSLIVHKELRSKRLAPLLIKEITRKVKEREAIWFYIVCKGRNLLWDTYKCLSHSSTSCVYL